MDVKKQGDLLRVDNLRIAFNQHGVSTTPVRSVSFHIAPGERVALVGESGCGKSLTAMSLVRLSPTDEAHVTGNILFDEQNLLELSPHELTKIRGSRISYVFQDPSASLNPVMKIYAQVTESISRMKKKDRISLTAELLDKAGIPDPLRAATAFPCELSGGQQQRVVMAMALAARPSLLVADEPTTALDVTTQRQVLELMEDLAKTTGMALFLITHNLGLVAGRMERVYVMYAGEIVESGPVTEVLSNPRHPYARGLLDAVPLLDAPPDRPLRDIPGTVPSADAWPQGCVFAPRCPFADERCHREHPELRKVERGRSFRCLKDPLFSEEAQS